MAAQASRIRRPLVVLLCCVGAMGAVAWYIYTQFYPSYVPAPPFTQRRVMSAFTENGVHVDIALEQDANGQLLLAGTFAPVEAHQHLYSMDLPRKGLNGAGRPTLLEVPAQSGVHSIGQLSADQPVILDQFATLNTAFPIYPDGAVTLRLPVVVTQHDAQMTVNVTYMACSSAGFCLPPVENKPILLTLTAPM